MDANANGVINNHTLAFSTFVFIKSTILTSSAG